MTYKQEDIFEAFDRGDINVILHQCNCTEGMGAGFAKKVALKYKDVKDVDASFREHNLVSPEELLGIGVCIPMWENRAICNLYSQFYTGSPKTGLFDNFNQRRNWLRKALIQVSESLDEYGIEGQIGIPLIASGLAADKSKKGSMTDLEYFKKYIEPIFLASGLSDIITVYYL